MLGLPAPYRTLWQCALHSILFSITQFWSKEPFYRHIYLLQLLTRAYTTPNTFCDRAILTIYNNTVAKINKAILMRLHGSLSTFYFIDTVEQNGEDNGNVVPLLPKLLQTFNFNNLPLLKLSLKIDTPVIFFIEPLPKGRPL